MVEIQGIGNKQFTSPTPVFLREFWLGTFKRANGSDNMAVNGSVTPVEFSAGMLTPGTGLLCARAVFVMVDPDQLRARRFAGRPRLTNGIEVSLCSADGKTKVLLGDRLIRGNDDIALVSGIEFFHWTPAIGDNMVVWEWPVSKFGYTPIMDSGDRVTVAINDDLSGMTSFRGLLKGRLVGVGSGRVTTQ